MKPIDAAGSARIAAIIAKAVKDYMANDQKASYPLDGDVWVVVKCKRAASKLKDGFYYQTEDGSLSIWKVDDVRVKLVAHQFPRSKNLWNGPDVLPNNELASMFASLFHDLAWIHKRELAQAMGLDAQEVLRFGNDVFFLAWRAIDSSFWGRVKSRLAFRAVSAATPWYHKLKGATAAFAVTSVMAGCAGCVSLPDGEAEEVGGVEIVEQIMRDYGDGLKPAARDKEASDADK